jgi:hypothetical protein
MLHVAKKTNMLNVVMLSVVAPMKASLKAQILTTSNILRRWQHPTQNTSLWRQNDVNI